MTNKDEICYCRIYFKINDDMKTICYKEKCQRWKDNQKEEENNLSKMEQDRKNRGGNI